MKISDLILKLDAMERREGDLEVKGSGGKNECLHRRRRVCNANKPILMFSALKNFIAPDGKAIKSQKIFHAYTFDFLWAF